MGLSKTKHIFSGLIVVIITATTAMAQEKWQNEGELESVEIEVINQRQITLPAANRNFEKIPPRPAEQITPPIRYNFLPLALETPQISPVVRPLKIKQQDPTKVYGGYVSAGYGNYASPYLEGFVNTARDKNKLLGAHALYSSSGKGPVDGKNSASSHSMVDLYGRTFNEFVSLSGDIGYENRGTHFYGYPEELEPDAKDIRQSFNLIKLRGAVANSKNTDFSYQLGAGFNYLTDRYDAKETEFDLDFKSGYNISDGSVVGITAGYVMLNRKDALVDGDPRNLFFVNPRYELTIAEKLRLSVGAVGAYENDTIDNKDIHAYPDFRASYPVSPAVQLVASLSGGLEKVSLQTLAAENMWIEANIPIFHTNKLYDLQAALNTKIGSKVTFSGGFSFAALKNWYYFVNSPADQSKFTVGYDMDKARTRTNFFATLGYAQAEHANILLRGDLYSYSKGDLGDVIHRPTYKVSLDAIFNISKKLLLDAGVIAQGGMLALDWTTSEIVELDAAFDVNMRVEYMVSDSFSVFAQLNNITSNKYPMFLNYPVRGFQGMGGVTWSF